jgi:hypothetical protein
MISARCQVLPPLRRTPVPALLSIAHASTTQADETRRPHQKEAEHLDMSGSHISDIEQGKREAGPIALQIIASGLETTVSRI